MAEWGEDTTAASSGGDGSGCRNCGEEGHMARDCPSKSDDGCRKCGESGHMAKDCSIPDKCRKCNEEGHMAKDCEIPDKCRKCNEEGHMARDCALPDVCRNCDQEGHMSKDCDQPSKCRRCGETGHMVSECTQPEVTRMAKNKDGEEVEIYVPKETADDELYENSISTGINFAKYNDIKVELLGKNMPSPIQDFSSLRPLLIDNINKSKYKVPTPVQKYAIPVIKARMDLMACAQTGSGKTAAFLLPIIHNLLEQNCSSNAGSSVQCPQAVIMTPTRELAIQIYEQARKFSLGSMIKCQISYGGTSTGFQLRNLQNGCNILVATPGRLLDFVEKGKVSFENIQFFVLDEADRMLDMGFSGDINKCMENPTMPGKDQRTTLMFSATFKSDVQQTAKMHLKKEHGFLTVGVVGATCKDVTQEFIPVESKKKRDTITKILQDNSRDPSERVLIFVNTKKNADFLATHLCQKDIPTTSIHGDRKQREREEALYEFKKGIRPVLVATAVAARGLDIPKVAHVINYDMPNEVDEYVHRIGRTGRVGNTGKATSFFDETHDTELVRELKELLERTGDEIPETMAQLELGDAPPSGGDGGGDDEDEW